MKKKKIEHRYKTDLIFRAFVMPQSSMNTPFGDITNPYENVIEVAFMTRVRIFYNGERKRTIQPGRKIWCSGDNLSSTNNKHGGCKNGNRKS